MEEHQRMHSPIRDISPCKNCTEKFTYCHSQCPKDKRGEYGYKAWTAELERVKKEKKQYLRFWNKRRYWTWEE